MNKLSKSQVIALFLGASKAAILDDLTAITLPPFLADGSSGPLVGDAVATNEGGSCNAQGGCDNPEQSCARLEADVDTCVHNVMCGAYGKSAGTIYHVNCWTVANAPLTPTPPTALTAEQLAANFLALEGLITKELKTDDKDNNVNPTWANVSDMIVSPMYNYMDGWWIKGADNKWTETNKPADQRCMIDMQCPSDSCCGWYPDANNRRCMVKTLDKVSTTVGPVTFTPSCTNITADDVTPENAQDDIAAGALAEANEEIEKWANNLKADAKTAAGYDGDACDQACKDKFDADWQAAADKEKEENNKLKALIGYDTDDCNDSCKAAFEAELLKWAKATYEICQENEKAPACANAYEIRAEVEKGRAGDGSDGSKNFYSQMSADERVELEKAEADLIAKQEAAIVAAATDPLSGEGSSCDGELQCSGENECCGDSVLEGLPAGSTPSNEQMKPKVCVRVLADQNGTVWQDQFGRDFTHTCLNAMKLASSVAAAAVATYYM